MIDYAWILTLMIVAIVGAFAVYRIVKKYKKLLLVVLVGIMALILPLRFVFVWGLYTQAEPIESTIPYLLKINVQKELPIFSQTKTSSKTIDSNKRQFFILYKVGCPYCNAAHAEINQNILRAKDKNQIFYVETSTPLGKTLVKKYQIKKAHTMIVTRPETKESQVFEEGLADTLSSGKTIYQPDKDSIHQAFQYFAD